jgi:hypothetical protein
MSFRNKFLFQSHFSRKVAQKSQADKIMAKFSLHSLSHMRLLLEAICWLLTLMLRENWHPPERTVRYGRTIFCNACRHAGAKYGYRASLRALENLACLRRQVLILCGND